MSEQSSNNKRNENQDPKSKKRGLFGTYLHYGFNPQLGKRLKQIGQYFGHFAYVLAMIYGAVRLIQPNHPILNPANVGKYGFRDVISTAAGNVKMTKENIDQVLIFFAVLFGLAIMTIQFVGIFFMVGLDAMLQQANAQTLASLFTVEDPQNDLALNALEMVFGTEIFGANAMQLPMVPAFHAMLSLFSSVALIIGIFLLIYYVFVVVSEAAMTGTPFGRRFNGLWAPIRLVVAFGLLIPVAGGLNAAQYITLYMAKAGSNLASNAWGTFADTFLDPRNLIAIPSASNMQEVVGNIFVNELCRYSYNLINQKFATSDTGEDGANGGIVVRARVPNSIINSTLAEASGARISGDGLDRAGRGLVNGDIGATLSGLGETGDALARGAGNVYGLVTNLGWTNAPLGAISPDNFIGRNKFNVDVHWTKRQQENRSPDSKCGAIRFHFSASDNIGILPIETLVAMRGAYLKATERIITAMNESGGVGGYGNVLHTAACAYANGGIPRGNGCNASASDGDLKDQLEIEGSNIAGTLVGVAHQIVEEEIVNAITQVSENDEALQELNANLKARGWAGAGAFFNTIARINGEVYDAANEGLPSVVREPTILHAAAQGWELLRPRNFLSWINRNVLGNGEDGEDARTIKGIIGEGGSWFAEGLEASASESGSSPSAGGRVGRWIGNFIADVFGAGLLDMRDNLSLNPLGQLAMGGKSLIARSMAAYAGIAVINIAMGLAPGLSVGQILATWVVPILSLLMTVGLGAGFVLYFLVPLLPFMYFLFAVVGWISEIFEAIVAMPLWALAHIRIEGDGLPGQAASTGYYLIFAIFTRPIFIVFGLIGAYASFMVGVYLLHNTFNIAVNSIDNQNGFVAGILDSLGFTIVYVIIVYNMANTSFKMIDEVPNQIMRWFGSPASSFSDGRQMDMQPMQNFAAAGAGLLGRELSQTNKGNINAVKNFKDNKKNQGISEKLGKKEQDAQIKQKSDAYGQIYGGGDKKKEAEISGQVEKNIRNGVEPMEGIDKGGKGKGGGDGANKNTPPNQEGNNNQNTESTNNAESKEKPTRKPRSGDTPSSTDEGD